MKDDNRFLFGVIGIVVAFVVIWTPILIWLAYKYLEP